MFKSSLKEMINSPLEQFGISAIYKITIPIISTEININNSNIFIGLVAVMIIMGLKGLINKKIVIKSKVGYIKKKVEEIIIKTFSEILTMKGIKYIIIIITIFIIILTTNIIGLIPYSFAIMSQLIITLLLSTGIIIGVTIIGIEKEGVKFIKMFIPGGIPVMLTPLIFIIEVISYLSRIISLSVRLSANIISGHLILAILSGFGYKMGIIASMVGFIPIIFIFYFLETAVALIQSFVFAVLTANYIKDVLSTH